MKKTIITLGNLVIDSYVFEVYVNQQYVHTSKKEFQLLYHLALHYNMICHREELIDAIWGEDFLGYDQNLDVYIGKLRKKIMNADLVEIKTYKKQGFSLVSKELDT